MSNEIKINDGGPAFPITMSSDGVVFDCATTLRDYFAAKAIAGMVATEEFGTGPDWADRLAVEAYKVADAMLRAREAK